ncbi:MAG: metallophosphoesterase [Pirellulales bacterium]|nr:metallophosphoesterase [Pirellulales bacterium]
MVASIEYIEKVIAAFGQAAGANRQTPGREGNIVVLTPELAEDVMITGDLHGHRRNFNLIKKIARLDHHPGRHLILQEVCHGGPTYPQNGGCMSHTMLEDVAKLKVQYPGRIHFILGNHELAELADYPIQKNRQMLNLLFRLGLQQMYGPAADKVRDSFFPFLRSCPLAVVLPGGVFVTHSVPENVDTQGFDKTIFTRELEDLDFYERTGIFQLVWGRDYRQENADAFSQLVGAKVLINGHEPCPEGFNAPNQTQIILDCCAEKASYAILPTNVALTHNEILQRVKKLA